MLRLLDYSQKKEKTTKSIQPYDYSGAKGIIQWIEALPHPEGSCSVWTPGYIDSPISTAWLLKHKKSHQRSWSWNQGGLEDFCEVRSR